MNSSVSIQFTAAQVNPDEYWIELEQVTEEDTAAPEEVADLIDSVFELNPCEEVDGTESEPVDEEDFASKVAEVFDFNLCYFGNDNNYVCRIKVLTSGQDEQYTIRLTNGQLLNTTVTSEDVLEHIEVTNQTSATLKHLPLSPGTYIWGNSSTSTPEITLTSRTLSWVGEVSGSITATYPTAYDIVEIEVYGEDEESGECTAVGFFHGTVDSLELEIPDTQAEELERWKIFCGDHSIVLTVEKNDTVPQWETIRTTYKCECSGEVDHYVDSNVATAADFADGKHIFPGITTDVFGGYIDCGEVTGDINNPDFYEERCCEQPPFALPNCNKVIRTNGGGKDLDPITYAALLSQYGDDLQVVAVSPPDGDCGTTTTEQHMIQLNCCDEVAPLVWNSNDSVEVMSDNSSGQVYVTGGRLPLTVSVFGNGFYLDSFSSSKVMTTYNEVITIYTKDACGTCIIRVTDGCSTTTGYVRSDNGQWVEVYRNTAGGATGFGGCPVTFADNSSQYYSHTFERISDKWQISQLFTRYANYYHLVRCCATGYPDYPDACALAKAKRDTTLITDDMITGSCFTFENTCVECSGCVAPIVTGDISFDVGYHSYIYYGSTSGQVRPVWSYIGTTIISEWQC